MKPFKNFLRIILASVSTLGFLGGWAMLAHSPKPAQPYTAQLKPLDPIQPLNMYGDEDGGGARIALAQSSRSGRRSMFRTGGS
jgi:hypothetical protein